MAGGSWLSLAVSRQVVSRALGYGLLVGTLLIVINHGDVLARGEPDRTLLLEVALTPLVPYLVSTFSTFSSVSAMRS